MSVQHCVLLPVSVSFVRVVVTYLHLVAILRTGTVITSTSQVRKQNREAPRPALGHITGKCLRGSVSTGLATPAQRQREPLLQFLAGLWGKGRLCCSPWSHRQGGRTNSAQFPWPQPAWAGVCGDAKRECEHSPLCREQAVRGDLGTGGPPTLACILLSRKRPGSAQAVTATPKT